jgi:hypothetical protein
VRTNILDKDVKPGTGALFVLAIAAIILAGAPEAFAQASGPRQGPTGLFGSGTSDAGKHQTLDLTLSSTQGYDSDVIPNLSTAVGLSGPESTGYSTTLVGGFEYAWQVSRVQFRATGTSTMRYLRPLDDLFASTRSLSHTAGVGIFARLPKRTTLLVNQTATHSPSYLYNLFPQAPSDVPGDAPPVAPDYGVSRLESHTYGTATTLAHDFTARNTVSAIGDYQSTDTFGGAEGRRPLASYGIRGHFAHRFGRNTAVLTEYLYRNSEFQLASGVAAGGKLVEHGVNVGVDYTRRLSASRHFTVGAVVGSSVTIVPVSSIAVSAEPSSAQSLEPSGAVSQDASTVLPESIVGFDISNHYFPRVSGQVIVGYEFTRNWKLAAIYRRGVDYIPGLGEPISADRFSTSVSGLLHRRVDILASAAYSNGESALNRQGSAFNTYTGDVRLRYALTRTFAAYVEYLYYFYDSRGGIPIAPGISSGLQRKGVRTGLTLRVPALRR